MTCDPDAVRCAERFIHAIVWAEHTTLWDLLSSRGRSTALSVAMRNGLDRVAAGRLRDDLADPSERGLFLQQLVNGLRRDLRSVELTELTVGECHALSENSENSGDAEGTGVTDDTGETADSADTRDSEDFAGSEDTVAVELLTPSRIPGTQAWSAGRLILSRDDPNLGDDPNIRWLVDRLEPRLAGP
ncbi:MAG: hypothetical protein OXE79_06500 [Acidimicrobiaceae bacterium]|nr:hypothetical protein [Acidimicrobiaceae bacterium]MCY4174813.1 hypothetical protein [Acidimicrobiaceae bacterium]